MAILKLVPLKIKNFNVELNLKMLKSKKVNINFSDKTTRGNTY